MTSRPLIGSKDARTLCDQGADYLLAGQLDEAMRCLSESVRLDPTNPVAHYRLGLLHSDSGRPAAALAAYDTCLRLDSNYAKAHNNRGSVLQVLGRTDDAFLAFERALQLDPGLEPPYVNLGHLLERSGRTTDACALYARALERGLNEGLFRHHLAAAAQQSTTASPPEWVRSTFDNFAPNFDAHLRQLGYSVPEQLATILLAHAPGPFDVVDLGCGTGLCGKALVALKRRLVGVDLSERMLVEARRLNVYDALDVAEIQAWLAEAPTASGDVVIAADVFIYIGALEDVFTQVHRILRNDGWFAFSIEEIGGTHYRLQPTGRYAQSSEYVQALAGDGFAIAADQRWVIRNEDGVPVEGRLYLLRRRPT